MSERSVCKFPYDGELVAIKVIGAVESAIPMARFTLARRMCYYADPFNYCWFVNTGLGIYLEDWEVEKWFDSRGGVWIKHNDYDTRIVRIEK